MQGKNSNKMAVMPVGKLIFVMSVPMMISFFIQALYNVVDSMFVARISENALTAVSIAYPVQNIIVAIGVGTGVGVNAMVPRYMGQGHTEEARKIANVAVFLSACYTLTFLAVGLTAVRPYYLMQTDVTDIAELGTQYLSIVCVVSVGAFFGQNFEKLLVATGNSIGSMIAKASGAVFNIIFDPLLIFGIGPFPEMGVRGAAAATVGGQIFAALVALLMLEKKEKIIRLQLRQMLPTAGALRDIYSVGIPSMITVALVSVMSFCMNQILLAFSTTATAVFGIWLKLQNFSFMPVFGLNNGTVPIISYNYGAGNMNRVRKTMQIGLTIAVSLMIVLCLVFELIPVHLLRLFSASDNMLEIGIIALRTAVISLPLGAVTLILSSAFQALGHSRYTLLSNLCRHVFFIVPVAWLLSLSGVLRNVWLAIPIAEGMSAALAVFLFFRMRRHI